MTDYYIGIILLQYLTSALVDLTVDEQETEETILLHACCNSVENADSPVAPEFSPLKSCDTDFNK